MSREMARTALKPEEEDDAQLAPRSGWLSGLFRRLFGARARPQRVDARPAAKSRRAGAPVQDRIARPAAVAASGDDAMHAELSALFKSAPGSREALRHLAAVRHGLKHKDSKGLFLFGADPTHVRAALRQLDGLMPKEPAAGLAALRARMVDAIATHARRTKRLEMLSPRSDLMHSERMEVREASTTEFDRALQR